MYGSHLSIAGGMYKAVVEAQRLGFGSVQVFTKNQQQWKVPPLNDDAVTQWHHACDAASFTHVVAHDSYLINLGSPDESARAKSIALFDEELRRCALLNIPYLVTHPGAHMGERDNAADERAGLERIALSLNDVLARDATGRTIVCIESTAGQGSSLGHRLEHLAFLVEHVRPAHRLGVCFDTAHLFAAGYDFRGRKYAGFLRDVNKHIGLDRVRVWHLNDSKKPMGSRVDRHEHIGLGTIGDDGFAPIVRDKRWRDIPKIMETPKLKHADGRDWDEHNLQRLLQLAKR